jgi:hypothetical protein
LLKVKVEDSNALRFILEDELYLLGQDRLAYHGIPPARGPIQTPPATFHYLGSNKKNFLVLVNYPEHEFMPGQHLHALESTLGRIGYSPEDVAIVNSAKSPASLRQLLAHFLPKILLILGQASIPAGLEEPPFNLPQSNEGLQVLYTFSFDAMMASTENKKAFWEQMKTL